MKNSGILSVLIKMLIQTYFMFRLDIIVQNFLKGDHFNQIELS